MKLSGFREILLKKSSNNEDLQSFIQNVSEDTLHEYVSELLEKALDEDEKRHRNVNSVVRQFSGELKDTDASRLYSHLSHHASKYIAATKAYNAEPDLKKKKAINDVANKHAAAFSTGVSLIQKMSKDAASNEEGAGTNHTKKAPITLSISAHKITPWQRNGNINRREEQGSKPQEVPGSFSSNAPGFSYKGGNHDFSYLRKKPHKTVALEHHKEDRDGSNRRNSSYPIQDTKLKFKDNETGQEYEHYINIDPEEKFSGKFEPHIMDSHPILGIHDHSHKDQDHFISRGGDHNPHPDSNYGGFVHTAQKNFPQDNSYVDMYNNQLANWQENVLDPASDTKSYKGNPIHREFAKQRSSHGIPLQSQSEEDEDRRKEQAYLINHMEQFPQTRARILKDHPELESLSEAPASASAAKSKSPGPAEGEEGHIPDEHLSGMLDSLESDPESAKSFLDENPQYGWIKGMLRPQEGEEGHIPDEHLPELVNDLASDPSMEQKFSEDPKYGWLKRRVEKEKVQRQIKEIMGKTSTPEIGVESMLKSISFLLKKNESFFNQNPELFIAVQERFFKAVTDEEDQQDEDQQDEDQQELQPEDVVEAGRGFSWDNPEEEDTATDEDTATASRSPSSYKAYDTKHLTPHGAKYLGLDQSQEGKLQVMHDPDLFSIMRGPALEYSGKSEHASNLEDEKSTTKHAGAKINSSSETKAHQSRQDQKNEAWKNFKNSKEYSDIINEHSDNPMRGKTKAEIIFNKKWRESGEHEKDLTAHKEASSKATEIHNQAKDKARSDTEERRSFLRGEAPKPNSGMTLQPDFTFSHSKTVDGKEHHDVMQGGVNHGTVVHDPNDPSKTQFVPNEKSTANPKTVMASFDEDKELKGFNKELEAFKQKNPTKKQIEEFKQERGMSSDEGSEESSISDVGPEGYAGVEDISNEGEAKANIYESDGDEGSTTGYRSSLSSGEYFKQNMQSQKPDQDKFQFKHNPSVSAGSVAHHDVFTKDQNNQPTKVGTVVHDVKDPGGPKFVPHGQSNMDPAEAVSAFKSKGVSYTDAQVKSMLNPEQSKRFDLVQGAKTKKGSM